jgi:hypothetical protein
MSNITPKEPRRYVGPPLKGTGRRERITVLLDPVLLAWLATFGPGRRNDVINAWLFEAKRVTEQEEQADAPRSQS